MINSPVLRLLVIAIAIFVIFAILLPGKFLSVANLQSMAVQFPEFGILAIAIMVTMISGGIDLSVVGAANLSSIAAALVLARLTGDGGAGMAMGVAIPLAMGAALIVGSLCGLFNGSEERRNRDFQPGAVWAVCRRVWGGGARLRRELSRTGEG